MSDFSLVAKSVFGIHLTMALYASLLEVELDVPTVAGEMSGFVYLGFFEPAPANRAARRR